MHNAALILARGGAQHAPNQERAFALFLQAANKGLAPSMVQLALIYLNNKEDKKKLKSALFWLEKAQQLGEASAQSYLTIANQAIQALSRTPINSSHEDALDELTELVEKSDHFIMAHAHRREVLALPGDEVDDEVAEAASDEDNHALLPDDGDHEEEDFPITVVGSGIKNIKLIRHNLRAIDQMKKALLTPVILQPSLTLSPTEQAIADDIFAGNTNAIDHHALVTLFNAPFFDGQVEITRTKNGIAVNAFNRTTKKQASTGTHRKHANSSKKGAEPAFVNKLKTILTLFSVKPLNS